MARETKIYNIQDCELFAPIYKLGFRYSRNCGAGVDGFCLALGISYFECLICNQNISNANIKFFREKTQVMKLDRFPKVQIISNQILNKEADKDEFFNACKSNSDLLRDICNFFKDILKLESCKDINSNLEIFSQDFNTAIYLFRFGETSNISTNRFTDAFQINIFEYQNENNINYLALYHENYNTVSIETCRLTEYFQQEADLEVDKQIGPGWLVEEIVLCLAEELKNTQIDENEKTNIRSALCEASKKSPKMYSFQEIINGILGPAYCNKCLNTPYTTTLWCGCKLCEKCNDLSKNLKKCCVCDQTYKLY
ncbi:hypothetical protein SteCoe_10967 [Stentor coeruleus]|uniref:Uncharacterized protein n=1 Tax=Stentor coeruleus TaxID=5963 RepID=A0A1R2CEC7_9CILI|nr:hypothetical protein SteCoe_10967 [Stentor coeruleus]